MHKDLVYISQNLNETKPYGKMYVIAPIKSKFFSEKFKQSEKMSKNVAILVSPLNRVEPVTLYTKYFTMHRWFNASNPTTSYVTKT